MLHIVIISAYFTMITAEVLISTGPKEHLHTIETSNLIQHSGVILHKLGTISTRPGVYKLIIPITFQPLDKIFNQMERNLMVFMGEYETKVATKNWTHHLITTKSKLRIHQEMKLTRNQIYVSLKEAYKRLEALKVIFQSPTEDDERPTRGLINFAGDAFSWLFGLATEEDLEETKSQVIRSQQRNMKIIHSTEHLASAVRLQELEVGDLLEHQRRLQNTTAELIKQMEWLTNGMAVRDSDILEKTLLQKIYHFKTEALLNVNSMSNAITLLLTELQEAIHGQLSPGLVNPSTLRKLMHNIIRELPPQFTPPELRHRHRVLQYYQFIVTSIMNLNRNNKAIVLNLPIFHKEDRYTLDFVTIMEIPFTHQVNITSRLQLQNSMIYATKMSSTEGFTITPDELSKCKVWQHHYYCDIPTLGKVEPWTIRCLQSLNLQGNTSRDTCHKKIQPQGLGSHLAYIRPGRWAFSIRGRMEL